MLAVTLAYLALYPKVQDTLYAEIRAAFGDEDPLHATLGYEATSKVPYALA